METLLRTRLPRPLPDPGFRARLLGELLAGEPGGGLGHGAIGSPEWRRRFPYVGYVGGAIAGAAAIALGAALGWRRHRGERAA